MLIDANIFLEFLLKQKKFEQCTSFFNKVVNGEVSAFVSDFTIDTITLSMVRHNIALEEIKRFLRSLLYCKGLIIYSINMWDRIAALEHMKEGTLDYEDALTVQAAIATESKEIISFDRHFDDIKEINRIEP